MPVFRVNIEPDILNWVDNVVSGDAIGTDWYQHLSDWIAGNKTPTFNQIEKISKASRIPLGYFFLKTPPAETFPLLGYRTIGSLSNNIPSRDLADTIHDMESIQAWMRDYLLTAGNEKTSIVSSCSIKESPISVAKKVKKDLSLKDDWTTETDNPWTAFKVFRKALESVGILVMLNGVVGNNTYRTLSVEEFRAFVLIDEYAPLIFINARDSLPGRLFSLIHESVHVWLGKENLYNDRYNATTDISPLETFCNAVTAEIIIPHDFFIKEWNSNSSAVGTIIRAIAKRFSCGEMVIARKALDASYISQSEYNQIVDNIIAYYYESMAEKDSSSKGNYYNTALSRIDRNLAVALDNSTREGKTLYTDAFRLTNTTRKTFPELIQRIRTEAMDVSGS